MPHKKRNSLTKIIFSIWTLLVGSYRFLPAAEIPCVWTGVERIVAVGDLHGDYDNFVLILKNPKVGLDDDNLHWSGGKTHLVQTGDILDRGDKAKEILDLLMRLEGEAEAAGGKVHILLGNHEELTITGLSLGYPDYVSARQFVSFLPENFRKAREKDYISRLSADEQALLRARGGNLDKEQNVLEFWNGILRQVRHRNDPEAALAYIENFNHKYGKWLLRKNCVIRINDIIFAHGGVNHQFSGWKLKDINDLLRLELGAYALRPTNPQLGGPGPSLFLTASSTSWRPMSSTSISGSASFRRRWNGPSMIPLALSKRSSKTSSVKRIAIEKTSCPPTRMRLIGRWRT